jgi:hypothetical protein
VLGSLITDVCLIKRQRLNFGFARLGPVRAKLKHSQLAGICLSLCYKARMSGERHLWSAVLGLAIGDVRGSRASPGALDSTRLWFQSDVYEPGSFLWICDHLNLNATSIRRLALGNQQLLKSARGISANFCHLYAWSAEILPLVLV